jgi:hypothetical protein
VTFAVDIAFRTQRQSQLVCQFSFPECIGWEIKSTDPH